MLTPISAFAVAAPAPDALLKHLLYYVARARDLDSEGVTELRSRYQRDAVGCFCSCKGHLDLS